MNNTDRLTAFTSVYTAEELYAKGYADGYENGRMSKEPVFFPPCEDCNKRMDKIRKAYEHRKTQISDTISELEKIKAKISMTNGCGDFIATYDIETLIDKHIAELKGE